MLAGVGEKDLRDSAGCVNVLGLNRDHGTRTYHWPCRIFLLPVHGPYSSLQALIYEAVKGREG